MNIFLAVLITLFSFPIGGLNVSAEGKTYDDIKDGEYKIGVTALETNSDKESGADSFLINKATLKVDGENITLETNYTKDVSMEYGINWAKIGDNAPVYQEENDKAFTYVFEIDEIKESYPASMNYYVPRMPGDMGDKEKGHSVDYRIVLDKEDLAKLPVKDEEADTGEKEFDENEDNRAFNNLEDGFYSVDASYINVKTGENSTMAKFLSDNIFLEVDGDSVELTITVEDNETVTLLQVEGQDPIEVTTKGKQNYETFKLNKLSTEYTAFTKYTSVWGDNVYNGEADFNIEIDEASLKAAEESDKPVGEPVKEETKPGDENTGSNNEGKVEDDNATEPEEEEEADVTKYSIDYSILHADKDEPSVANEYFVKPGTLIEKDGKTYFQAEVTSWSMIQDLKYNDKNVKVLSEDKEKDTALIELKVEGDLSKEIPLSFAVVVPGVYDTTHTARLVFDVDSKKLIIDETSTPADPKENRKKDSGEKPKPTPKPKNEETNKIKPDEAYEIDYVIYHADKDVPSLADDFFKKPGILLKKDREKYLQIKITSWSMIDDLKYNEKNVLVIDYDEAKDIATVQLKIDGDLSEIIPLTMHITVPGLYSEEHDARLVLFPDTMKEISTDGLYIYKDVPKPSDFGENGDGKGAKKGTDDNPKTGDTSQILFFSTLLVASLSVLVLQVRRRLAA